MERASDGSETMEGAMDVTREQAMGQGARSDGCYKRWIRKQAMDPGAIEEAITMFYFYLCL